MSIKEVFHRFKQERIAFISFIFLVMLSVVAIFAPFIVPYDPNQQDLVNVLANPSLSHWLGTDNLGKDIFSQVMMGTRTAIQASIFAILIPLFIGVPLGIMAGYIGGLVDDIFMRIIDAIMAIPGILLALGITAALGISLWNAMIAIGIVSIPQFARLARGQTLQIRTEPYVEAAKISGAGPLWTMYKHIIPNILPPILVQASVNISFAVLTETSLSFLGMGAQSPQISWGSMIEQAYSLINLNPWLIVYPGIATALTVMAGNFVGDGLRVAIDPKLKG
ncbi:ABC transporter permease [Pseudogracilibacillus sp. SO30301A]|uniref:ABC transporter permease n=1 Tax=Pseudogracilibacillus sp. SO30301A TaxID=3098291 RepID=UPI00300DEEA7